MEEPYYISKESVDEYLKLAKDINGGELIEQLNSFLKGPCDVLELGSGPGNDWEILNNLYNTTGSDFSPEFINHLKNRFPNGDFIQLDAKTIETNKVFDAVYANKVLQHLSDKELQTSITRHSQILKENGIICHTYWKGDGSEMFKNMYVNYQNEESLELIYAPHFKIIALESYQEFEPNDSLLIIARKN